MTILVFAYFRSKCTGFFTRKRSSWGVRLTSTSILCRGEDFVELYLHIPHPFMTYCLTEHKAKLSF